MIQPTDLLARLEAIRDESLRHPGCGQPIDMLNNLITALAIQHQAAMLNGTVCPVCGR